jgi:hypothetical protein
VVATITEPGVRLPGAVNVICPLVHEETAAGAPWSQSAVLVV